MSKTFIILSVRCLAFLVLFFPGDVQAKEQGKLTSVKPYKTIIDIPHPLLEAMRTSYTRVKYIDQALRFIRENGHNHLYLSLEPLRGKATEKKIEARKAQFLEIIVYDHNRDGNVTADEIKTRLLLKKDSWQTDERYEIFIQKKIIELFQVDHDKNGLITLQEMRTLSSQDEKRINNSEVSEQYRQYLALDPNQDGKLTVNELEVLANKAFATADSDGDSLISWEERKRVVDAISQSSLASTVCGHDEMFEDTKVISIQTRAGAAVSSVTVADQEQTTTAVPIHIKKSVGPLSLVLSSDQPIIWQITGDVQSVKQVVLHSSRENAKYRTVSGVSGIAKGKIQFVHHTCIPEYYKEEKSNSAITQLVGRGPDLIVRNNRIERITITSDGIDFLYYEPTALGGGYAVPTGFHPKVWPIGQFPGGLSDIEPDTVHADGPVQKYEVLPSGAGLAQLAYDGFITPAGGKRKHAFKILKDIPRFPAGLEKAYEVTFILAQGVKFPKGNPGKSCVLREQTGEVLSGCVSRIAH